MINLPCCNFQPDKYYISYSIDLYSALLLSLMVVMYSTDMSAPAKAHAVGVLTGILTLHKSSQSFD